MTRRWGRRVLAAAAGVLGLLLLLIAAGAWLADVPPARRAATRVLSQSVGQPVHIGALSVRVLPTLALVLDRVEVGERTGRPPAAPLAARRARARLAWLELLRGRLELVDVELDGIDLTRPEALFGAGVRRRARAPRTEPGAPSVTAALRPRLSVVGGRVSLPGGMRLEDVHLALVPERGGAVGVTGDARLEPGGVVVRVLEGRVVPAAGRPLGEASLAGRLAVERGAVGPLARELLGGAVDVSGTLSGTLRVHGTFDRPEARGELTVADTRLVRRAPACGTGGTGALALGAVELAAELAPGRVAARPVTFGLGGALGGGAASARVTVGLGPGARVEIADAVVRGVELEPILGGLMCLDWAVAGTLDGSGGLGFDAARPLTTLTGVGSFTISDGRLVGGRALALAERLGRAAGGRERAVPVEFDAASGTYRAAGGVLLLRDLRWEGRGVSVSGAADYGLPTGRVGARLALRHARWAFHASIAGPAESLGLRVERATWAGVPVPPRLRELLRGGR